MALLTWRSAGGPSAALSAALLSLGCSFVLDTESLRKGGDAATSTQTGTGGSAGAPTDAASDAPVCAFADHDPCSDCLGMHCCAETNSCTHDATCNLAYVDFQQCQRAAKKAPNPAIAQAMCTINYRTRGGTMASGLVGCSITNCSTLCGG